MSKHYNLLGAGIGPFHLSLAAMLEKVPGINSMFLEQRSEFFWHPELLHHDADMQTSFYKDLVTPVDPTSRHSFLNYLVEHGLFYAFMNTGRKTITRMEFEQYGKWVSKRLENLKFNEAVKEVTFSGKNFVVKTENETFSSDHFSFATGAVPNIPDCAKPFLSEKVFHPKSGHLATMDLTNKRVVIVGGGQTGIEIFRNALHAKWGRPASIKIVSRRQNLEPLDETPFTNEYFSPSYNEEFFKLNSSLKEEIVSSQKLASDGNTPAYLEALYKDLYLLRHVIKDPMNFDILPARVLSGIDFVNGAYKLKFAGRFTSIEEEIEADIVILATGLTTALPKAIDGIRDLLMFDEKGRPHMERTFRVKSKLSDKNKIYALNFSRHAHGISEPQTSLMAWRSAMIANDLAGTDYFRTTAAPGFITYGTK